MCTYRQHIFFEWTKLNIDILETKRLAKTAAYMLPILERLLYRPQQVSVTRVLILTPTRELAIQVLLTAYISRINLNLHTYTYIT